jgi:DNA mismatch endonuclease (patch repair protein)
MTWPKANAGWWRDKIRKNAERDRDTDQRLQAAGWTVLRIWEHDDLEGAAAERIAAVVSRMS